MRRLSIACCHGHHTQGTYGRSPILLLRHHRRIRGHARLLLESLVSPSCSSSLRWHSCHFIWLELGRWVINERATILSTLHQWLNARKVLLTDVHSHALLKARFTCSRRAIMHVVIKGFLLSCHTMGLKSLILCIIVGDDIFCCTSLKIHSLWLLRVLLCCSCVT